MAPNMKRMWVDDGPLPLIESPLKKILAEGKTKSTAAATGIEMSNIHNVIIRGLNSILLQAPYITEPRDQQDMILYAHALCLLIHEHHKTEETLFFPLIEQATGVTDIMEKNVVQHEVFAPGLHHFDTYVKQMVNGVAKYDAKKLVGLVESFAPSLTTHLTDEISTLMGLETYDINWDPVLEKAAQYAMEHTDKYRIIPFFMSNLDRSYEEGIHKDWPEIPWFVGLIFRYLYIPKNKTAWRFAACDSRGMPKELPFAPLKDVKPVNESAGK